MVDHIRRLRNASAVYVHRPQNLRKEDLPLAFQKVQQLQLESNSLGEYIDPSTEDSIRMGVLALVSTRSESAGNQIQSTLGFTTMD